MALADQGVCMFGDVGEKLLVSLQSSLYCVDVGADNISKVNILICRIGALVPWRTVTLE